MPACMVQEPSAPSNASAPAVRVTARSLKSLDDIAIIPVKTRLLPDKGRFAAGQLPEEEKLLLAWQQHLVGRERDIPRRDRRRRHMHRDEDHELGLATLEIDRAEQRAEHRNVSEPR